MSYERYLDGEPVVITAALTGGVHGKEANSNVPETPEEIGERRERPRPLARRSSTCMPANRTASGASRPSDSKRSTRRSVAHRRRDTPALDRGTAATADKRHQRLRTDPPPEMASLDIYPVNRYDHLTSENTRAMVDRLFDEMVDREIKPELELFNDGGRNARSACSSDVTSRTRYTRR